MTYCVRTSPPEHFCKRVKERMPQYCPKKLFPLIVREISREMSEFAERVARDKDTGALFYRIHMPDQKIYAVVVEHASGEMIPVTVFTHEMWRRKRRGMKHRNKYRSNGRLR